MNETRSRSPAGQPWGCAKHALVERTCCETAEVFVTEGDKARIRGVGNRCPGHVVPPGGTILGVLGMRREDAERWHRILYTELRLPHARRTHV